MKKSEVTGILADSGLSPNRRLGQNFLASETVAARIIDAVDPRKDDHILEIGPGLGALTQILAERAGRVTGIEIDSGLVRYLNNTLGVRANMNIIHGDFLKLDLTRNFTKVVSNLPYYCSSEMLYRIAQLGPTSAYVMLQRELADRIIASPGGRDYGALSVTVSFYFQPRILFNVSSDAFYPKPEVTSSFLELTRRPELTLSDKKIPIFHLVVKSAFWGRRKTILKALSHSPHLKISREKVSEILNKCGIEEQIRAEELSVEQYAALTKSISSLVSE